MPQHLHRVAVACQRLQVVLVTVLYMLQSAALAAALYANQWYWKQPYHTSALSGAEWVEELVYEHPDHIQNSLGMWGPCFSCFYQ